MFCSFVFWTHAAFTTRPWGAAYELVITHPLTAVRFCCTAVVCWVGGSVGRCVDGFVGGWVRGWVRRLVRG